MTAAEIEALAKGATQGPWILKEKYGDRSIVAPGVTRKGDGKPKRCESRDTLIVGVTDDGACGDPDCCGEARTYEAVSPADAVLIVALVNSLPEICAAMRLAAAVDLERKWHESPQRSVSCLVLHLDGVCPDFRNAENERMHLGAIREEALSQYRASKEPSKIPPDRSAP